MKRMKRVYDKNRKFILIGVLAIVLVFGAVSLQSGYQLSGIWEADVQIYKVGASGSDILRQNIPGATISSVMYDFDGAPSNSVDSMISNGLDPELHFTIGSFFHTNEYGDPTSDRGPKEIVDVDGIRYVTYYFGFSVSVVTRSDHPAVDPTIAGFDYYGEDVTLAEMPEFASTSVLSEVGIVLANVDDTIPTNMGVNTISKLEVHKTYTIADSMGYDDDLDAFNYQYDWNPISHEGVISDPSFTPKYQVADGYASKVVIESTMSPGSEYVSKYNIWGWLIGASWNVYDVELIVDVKCEVVLDYELAADVNGYLENRLDLGGADDLYASNIWEAILAFFASIIAAIASVLGIDTFAATIILAVVAFIGIFIFMKVVLGRRRAIRLAYGGY